MPITDKEIEETIKLLERLGETKWFSFSELHDLRAVQDTLRSILHYPNSKRNL